MADLELSSILPCANTPGCFMWILARQVFYWLSYLLNLVFLFIITINQSISISIYLTHITNQTQWSTLVIPVLERWRQVDPWILMASQPSLIGKSQSLMKDPVSKQKVASPLCGLCDFHLGRIRRCRR